MNFGRTCKKCDKLLKQAVKGGRKVWVCKTPTCKQYGKPQ